MLIHSGIEIIDLSLYLKASGTLIISDLHLGYEGELHKRGVLVPKTQFKQVIERLDTIFTTLKKKDWPVKEIVLNGDVKHEFGKISEQEWREVLRLLDYLQKHCSTIIVVEGNHDPVLAPVAAKRNLKLVKEYLVRSTLIIHGDEEPDLRKYSAGSCTLKGVRSGILKPKLLIMGHEHPALCLREGGRVERFKCFLKGLYQRVPLICQPSFNPLTEGTDMLSEERLSPLLDRNIEEFEAWIVADDVYYFGKLKKLL